MPMTMGSSGDGAVAVVETCQMCGENNKKIASATITAKENEKKHTQTQS